MKKIICAILSFAFLFIFCGAASAGSLWNDNVNWIADKKPGRIGDIVNVKVSENTKTSDAAKTDLKKDTSSSIADGTGILSFIRAFGLETTANNKGDGTTTRNHSATTIIACVVTEVLPNGNLVIEGTRDIRTNEETLQMQILGVIRPQDIDARNQIQSDLIANAEIGIKGKGALSRLQKPGILTQILQTIF